MNSNNTGASTDVNAVLITGGAGSFGKAMLRDLLRRGYSEVRVLSRDDRLRCYIGDIRDRGPVARAMKGLDAGCIIMTGLNSDTIVQGVDAVTRIFAERVSNGNPVPADYCVNNTSERVVSLILGTAKLSNVWDGVRMNDLG